MLAFVHNLRISKAQTKKPSAIIKAMQRYMDRHINETMERDKFRRQTQQQGESFDNCLISLRDLAKTCRFCFDACMQKTIRDQIIEGLQDEDEDTVEDLLQELELTLATTVIECRSEKAAKKESVANGSPMTAVSQPTIRSTTEEVSHMPRMWWSTT